MFFLMLYDEKFQRVLPHGSQSGGKKVVLEYDVIKKVVVNFIVMQEHFRGCTGRIEIWNDVSLNKNFKKVGVSSYFLIN